MRKRYALFLYFLLFNYINCRTEEEEEVYHTDLNIDRTYNGGFGILEQ